VPVDVQCTMDDTVHQNQTQFDTSQCTWTKTMLMCYGMHLRVPWCGSEGILPLRIGAASIKLYIERGADWCGQGKNNSFLRGAERVHVPTVHTICMFAITNLGYLSNHSLSTLKVFSRSQYPPSNLGCHGAHYVSLCAAFMTLPF